MNKLLVLLSTVFLFGCETLNKNEPTLHLDGAISTNLHATVAVDMAKKLKGSASASTLFGFFQISGPTKFADGVFASPGGGLFSFLPSSENIKSAAAYNAVKAGNAEVIVAPQYIIEKKDYLIFSTTTAVVTGYAGTIKKIE